jgi:hypothetical protein
MHNEHANSLGSLSLPDPLLPLGHHRLMGRFVGNTAIACTRPATDASDSLAFETVQRRLASQLR